jgi:hypothetical protein
VTTTLTPRQLATIHKARAIVKKAQGIDIYTVSDSDAVDLSRLTTQELRVVLDAFSIREEFVVRKDPR